MNMDDLSPEERAELEAQFKKFEEFRHSKFEEYLQDAPAEFRDEMRNSKPIYYKLDQYKNPVPCTFFEFAMQTEDPEKFKRVELTRCGPYAVSTVFLCIDHSFLGRGGPVLFETMIWSEKRIEADHEFFEHQWRYRTWADALAGHKKVVDQVEKGLLP
jgi:hypothetical protein